MVFFFQEELFVPSGESRIFAKSLCMFLKAARIP
jgi:hypothetical protein